MSRQTAHLNTSANYTLFTYGSVTPGFAIPIVNAPGYTATAIVGSNALTLSFTHVVFIWTGAAGDHKWTTAGNWQGGIAPDGRFR